MEWHPSSFGLILSVVALFLIYETKALVVGESANRETLRSIQKMVAADEAVVGAERPFDRIETAIRERHPEITRIFIEAESLKEQAPQSP